MRETERGCTMTHGLSAFTLGYVSSPNTRVLPTRGLLFVQNA